MQSDDQQIRDVRYHSIKGTRIVSARFSRYNYECFQKHSHNAYSVAAVVEGKSKVIIGNKEYIGTDGDVVIINPGTIHSCNPAQDTCWSYYLFYFDRDWFEKMYMNFAGLENIAEVHFKNNVFKSKEISDTLIDLYSLFEENEILPVIFEDKLTELLGKIFTLTTIEEESENKNIPEALEAVRNYIEDHYVDKISLEELSDFSGISQFHLLRLFRNYTGLAPHSYLLRHRIERSREMIPGNNSVADVAIECGFSDQSHFIRYFKKYVGCTPGEYGAGSTEHRSSGPLKSGI